VLLPQVIGDILFGVGFFTVGAVVLFAFSVTVCDAVEHYIDGLFFFVLCMLLSVMMVYKVSFELLFPPSSLSQSASQLDPLLISRCAFS